MTLEVEVGAELPTVELRLEPVNAIMYAGASGDFNPLHFSEDFASTVSPTGGVIAHGMLSMGLASRVLTSWAGGPERVAAIEVRFTKPWPLGTTATFGGRVAAVEDGEARVELWGRAESGEGILSGAGRVRLGT